MNGGVDTTQRPTIFPTLLGVPVSDFLNTFSGESCDDPRTLIHFELNDAEPDVVQIVRYLAQFVTSYARNACVISFAQCIVSKITTPNDTGAQFLAVTDWMIKYTVYQADPVGIEYVRSPVQMMKDFQATGAARGDCDDLVLLVCSLFRSLGFQTKVAALKINGSSIYNHVAAEVKLGNDWKWLDFCKPSGVFNRPNDTDILEL